MGLMSLVETAEHVDVPHDAARWDAGSRRTLKARTKRAMMERVGYGEVARISMLPEAELARAELRPAVEAALNVQDHVELSEQEHAQLVAEILNDVVGLGPLQPLLEEDRKSVV